jgi:hypothetical protein
MTSATNSPLAMHQPVSDQEKTIVTLILLVAALRRLYGIPTWLLANMDEVSALNQIDLPFLSGASTHSDYLLTTILLKTVGGFSPFL